MCKGHSNPALADSQIPIMNILTFLRPTKLPLNSILLTTLFMMVMSATEGALAQITVSRNVHMSASRSQQLQAELILDADVTRPGRLMACSLIDDSRKSGNASLTGWGVIVYLTDDGGKTWTSTLEEFSLMDPTCAFGPDGTAYLEAFELSNDRMMRLYRSADGGRTWGQPIKVRVTDRPHLTVDKTGGKFNGRVYSHGQAGGTGSMDGGRGASGVRLYTSTDGGRTFGDPVQRQSVGARRNLGSGNGVVLSDGTLVMLFGELKEYWNADDTSQIRDSQIGSSNGRLRMLTSNDGGRSLSTATTISDFYMHVYPWRPSAGFLPWIAVDSSKGPFRDRLYVVWPDRRSGRDEILMAYSSDSGRTWSRPVTINDDRAPAARRNGPDHFMPIVAVNKEGVVGVSWYDRRDHADNAGWDIRFSASLDGGDTWSPNLRVSEQANTFTTKNAWPVIAVPSTVSSPGGPASLDLWVNQMLTIGGDTTGLVADSTGAFQVAWADNRTGILQLWSSAVTVKGTAQRNGDAVLALYKDVTSSVSLETSEMVFDRANGTLSLKARLKNNGAQAVAGPIKVRVVQLRSDLGVAQIEGAENDAKGPGAIWDFTGALNGKALPAGELSQFKELRFRVSDIRGLPTTEQLKLSLVKLDVRVLAGAKAE